MHSVHASAFPSDVEARLVALEQRPGALAGVRGLVQYSPEFAVFQ